MKSILNINRPYLPCILFETRYHFLTYEMKRKRIRTERKVEECSRQIRGFAEHAKQLHASRNLAPRVNKITARASSARACAVREEFARAAWHRCTSGMRRAKIVPEDLASRTEDREMILFRRATSARRANTFRARARIRRRIVARCAAVPAFHLFSSWNSQGHREIIIQITVMLRRCPTCMEDLQVRSLPKDKLLLFFYVCLFLSVFVIALLYTRDTRINTPRHGNTVSIFSLFFFFVFFFNCTLDDCYTIHIVWWL